MKLAEIAIKRPVFLTMVTVALIVMGLLGYSRMKTELFPSVDFPVVTVSTVYPGAGPEQVENQITTVIEEAVNSISGIKHITSTSQEGLSIVVIQFDLNIKSINASQDVREKIGAIINKLPSDAKDPLVQRIDQGAAPILSMVVSSPSRNQQDLTEYIKRNVKPAFENVTGVGKVELLGGSERQINIKVNLQKLNGYGISIQDLGQKIQFGNMEYPGGRINEGQRELLVRTMGRYKSAEELQNIIVKNVGSKFVRLSDVAEVEDGTIEVRSYSSFDGEPAIALQIIKQSDANTVEAAKLVEKALEKLREGLAPDVKIKVVDDTSVFIENSVRQVEDDIVIGGILAVLIIFLFLANGASTFISALAIPTSIIGTFGFMYFFGFSLNFMTLLALSLSVGLLIDDAIVIIENIYRHLALGEKKSEAALKATAEIGLAVLATTFTIVAVFVPVATMQGIVGRFFFPFGITVAIAVIISLFVAFTLTPMMSAKLLDKEEHLTPDGPFWKRPLYYFNHFFDSFNRLYQNALAWSLNHKLVIVIVASLAFFGSFFIAGKLGSEFVPNQDQGKLSITVKAPPGSSLEYTKQNANMISERIRKNYPEVSSALVTIGSANQPVNIASVTVYLKPKSEREKNNQLDVFNLIFKMRNEMKDISGIQLWYGLPSNVGPPQKPLQISVQGPDLNITKGIAEKVYKIFENTPGVVDIESSYEESKPEIQVRLKRDVATEAGIDVFAVAQTVQSFIDGVKVSDFQEGDQQYEVRVQLRPEDRTSLDQISQLMVKSKKKNAAGVDMMIPLSTVATITEGSGPSKITRYDRQRQVAISANLAGTYLGNANSAITAEIDKMKANKEVAPGYFAGTIGMADQMAESFGYMVTALLLGIVFIYLVLASQFESYIHPISIMMSLPLSMIGAFLGLLIGGSSISIMSLIGIIMLFGLVTKNAILLIDFTNQLRREGYSRTEALLKAGPIRLRPILMTTLAMIFGMLPVALALGEGSESRAPLGQAVIGGVITSTVLTLIVVPVIYILLEDFAAFLGRVFGKIGSWFGRKPKTESSH